MLIKALVEEKESKRRELMRVSGLVDWALPASVAATYSAIFLGVATVSAGVLSRYVFPHTPYFFVWLLLVSLCACVVPLCFAIAACFSQSRLAAVAGPFLLFALITPRFIFLEAVAGQALPAQRASCLLGPTAFTFATEVLASYEAGNSGLTFQNWGADALSFRTCVGFMWLDALLYSLLAFYLDRVLPCAVGAPMHPLFFLPSAWRRRGGAARRGDAAAGSAALGCRLADEEACLADSALGGGAAAATAVDSDVEAAPAGATSLVSISAASKTFGSGASAVRAVRSLSLDLFEDQITVLLGRNGAGKRRAKTLFVRLCGDPAFFTRRLTAPPSAC